MILQYKTFVQISSHKYQKQKNKQGLLVNKHVAVNLFSSFFKGPFLYTKRHLR